MGGNLPSGPVWDQFSTGGMSMKKRILSTFLALAMCLSLLPTSAFATAGNNADIPNAEALKKFFSGSTTGNGVYLGADIQLTEALTVSAEVELDLNGHKITGGDITVDDDASLTLTDSVGDGSVGNISVDGKLIVRNAVINHLYAGYDDRYPSNTVEISGGTIQAMDVYANAKVTLSDVELGSIARWGEETTNGWDDEAGTPIYITDYSNVPTYAEMLADGYAYQYTTGNKDFIKLSEISGQDYNGVPQPQGREVHGSQRQRHLRLLRHGAENLRGADRRRHQVRHVQGGP